MSPRRQGPKRPPTWRTRLGHEVQWALAAPFFFVLPRLPDAWLLRLGNLLGALAYRLDRRHRRVALDNLRLALPELDDGERDRIVRQSFRHLAGNPIAAISSLGRRPEDLLPRFECEGWENLEAAEKLGRGTFLLTAHFGAWSAGEQYPALRGKPIAMLHRTLDNPHIERQLQKIRARFGNRSIPKRSGTREILKTLKAGGRVAFLMDQRVHPNEGKAYRFFGRPAYTSPLLAMLSLRTGAPVVPGLSYPLDGGRRARLVFLPPILPDIQGDDAVDRLTLRYLKVLEDVIRADPGLWLWMHRRWRKNPTYFPKRRLPKYAAGPDSDEVVGDG